ncbi:hypothetical protein [Pseudomonas kurunegalensis]|uniref:hypothetical protein n=1 Tax=Pseudomonas kurunegalensis TaxID=485880 RepID=UPI0023646AE9|nr:hypothetical protein [Pseudomonas kurunegalensis]MDD2135656.1 hypothetical protein [Pseudomonas kurunegalensis]
MALWEPVGGVFTASASWLPRLSELESLGNSSFFTTVFGALAGAYFGAWAAQKIAKRSKRADELIKEIRSCNLGISLAIYTFEIARSLHDAVDPLRTNYQRAFKAHLDAQEKGERLTNPRYELEGWSIVRPPVDALRKILYEDITASTNALRAMPSLDHAVDSAITAVNTRNALLEDFRHRRFPESFGLYEMYFGMVVKGEMHRDYPDTISHLGDASDEMLFFSEVLCKELHQHACSLREEHRAYSKDPVVIRMLKLGDKSEAYQVIIREKYSSWFEATSRVEEEMPRRWWQFWRK